MKKLCLVGVSVTETTDNIPHLGIIMSGLMWLSFAGGCLSYFICEGLLFPASHSAPGIQAKVMDPLCICPRLRMKWTLKCSSLLVFTCSWTLLRGSLQNVSQIPAGALSKSLYFQGTPCCSCSQFLSLVHCLVFWDTVLGAACWEYSSTQKSYGHHPNLSYKFKQIFPFKSKRIFCVQVPPLLLLWWLTLAGLGAHKSCSVAPLLIWTGERKYKACESRKGQREITHQWLSWAKPTSTLWKFHLIYYQSDLSRIVRK